MKRLENDLQAVCQQEWVYYRESFRSLEESERQEVFLEEASMEPDFEEGGGLVEREDSGAFQRAR